MMIFEKYRPQTWDELAGQEKAVKLVKVIRRHDRTGPGQEHRVGAGVGLGDLELPARGLHGAGGRILRNQRGGKRKGRKEATQHAAATVNGGFGGLSSACGSRAHSQSPSVRPSQLGSPWTMAAQLQLKAMWGKSRRGAVSRETGRLVLPSRG
jgi:hypothetical protein